MISSLLLPTAAALTLLPTTLALEWFGPRATPTPSQPDAQGWTPKPTNGPQFNVVANANQGLKYFRRQVVQSKYPNTCGYVEGNGAYSFTCSGAYACGYNSQLFAFGCCSGTSSASDGNVYFTEPCYVDTTTTGCYASTESDLCTGSCTINAAMCTESTAPICRTVLQYGTAPSDPLTYTLYDCIPLGGRTLLSLQADSSFSSFDITPNPLVDPSYTFDGTTFVPIASLRTTSTPRVPFTTTDRDGLPTDPPVPVPRRKKSNTGAIAGGVVGGLVAVGLAAGGVIWALMRRKERARREAGAVQEVSHVTYVHDGK